MEHEVPLIGYGAMSGEEETGWSLQLPECLTGFLQGDGPESRDRPGNALDASDTTEPLLDTSPEATPKPQDMDRGEASGGDQHEAAAGATTECGLVNRMRCLYSQIAFHVCRRVRTRRTPSQTCASR